MAASSKVLAGFDRDSFRQLLNLGLAVSQAGVVVLGYLDGSNRTFDQRGSYSPPIVPAGYAFAIWGYIYPASLVYGAYQALPAQRRDELLRRVGYWTASAYASMTMWIICAQRGWSWLTVACIFWMLASLIGAMVQIATFDRPLSWSERWLMVLPISVHAGWVTAAAIANTATALDDSGVRDLGLPAATWASIMAVIGAAIGAGMTWWSRSPGYALAVVWALVGIAAANRESEPGLALLATAGAGAVALALLATRWNTTHP